MEHWGDLTWWSGISRSVLPIRHINVATTRGSGGKVLTSDGGGNVLPMRVSYGDVYVGGEVTAVQLRCKVLMHVQGVGIDEQLVTTQQISFTRNGVALTVLTCQ